MEEALLETEQVSPEATIEQKNSLDLIKDWLSDGKLLSELKENIDFRFGTPDERLNILSGKNGLLEKKRMELGVILPDAEGIPEENTRAEEYHLWDVAEANNIIDRYNQQQEAQSKAEIEAIMPREKPEEASAEIVDMDHLAETQKIDMGKELANYEMSKMYPETPEKIFTRTTAERYSDLVTKAEAKAREYEQKISLTEAETKRLAEIKSDIAYFSERMQKAMAAEQSPEPIKQERTPEAIREEIIQLKEKPVPPPTPSKLGDPEAVAAVAETITEIKTPQKRGFFSRWFGGSETEIPPEPIPPTPREKILQSVPKPLKPVDNINRGVPLHGQ